MNRRRLLVFAGVFLLSLVIALMLRDVVERTIIAPLAYFWWLLKLYYSAFPQYMLWILLILITAFSAASSLLSGSRPVRKHIPEPVIIHGQVADLADWITKSRSGIYYKWLVANRLGKNAREILSQRDGYQANKKFGKLEGRDWHPPKKISAYLETGLNGSFANFPKPHRLAKPEPTPLDMNPQEVIDYLESEMEITHNGNRNSS